ncbi:MAG: sulfite exporter TauE/SafE family protein [Rubrivivax sp.]|nr:sulfite exporter TauE/SafE family protein [Rubrivivax sp.]
MFDLLYAVAVLLTAYFVLGVTGMGSALIVVPLLAQRWPLPEVVALSILLDVPASILHGGLNLRHVQWQELLRLVPGMAMGTLCGLWLLGQLDPKWPLFALGIYVLVVAVRARVPQAGPRVAPAARWGHLAAWVMGVIEVMFATAGPVVVAWLQTRRLDAIGLRATVPVVMVLAGTVAAAVLFGFGRTDLATVGPRWLAAMPIAAAGVALGNRVAKRISPLWMGRMLATLLAISGIALTRHVWA